MTIPLDYLDYQEKLSQTIQGNGIIQNIFSEKNLIEVIGDFGEKYNLNLEQTGVIYDLVDQILTGEMNAGGFTEKLQKIAGEENWGDFDGKKIGNIVADLNQKIFLPIREAMRKVPETPQQTEQVPSREDILHGIENPIKTSERISMNKINSVPVPPPPLKTIPVPPPPQAPSSIPTQKVVEPTPVKSTAVEILPNMNIMEAKLGSAVKMPVTEVKITQSIPSPVPKPPTEIKPPQQSIPKNYTTDPYREPPTA